MDCLEPTRPPPITLRAAVSNFPRRLREAFLAKDALTQAAIIFGIVSTLVSAVSTYKVWLIPTLQFVHLIARPSEESKPIAAPSIFLECKNSIIPRIFPPSGRVDFTEILPSLIDERASLALGYRFGTPGAATLPPDVIEWAHECTFTNYGNLPVFNVVVPIRVTFREAHHPRNQSNGWQSGPIKAVKETSLTIAKIDAGKDYPFVLYLKSQNTDFVELNFLEAVKLQEGSDQTIKLGRLIVAPNSLVQFSPNEKFQMKTP
jgi:hypothetical protein